MWDVNDAAFKEAGLTAAQASVEEIEYGVAGTGS